MNLGGYSCNYTQAHSFKKKKVGLYIALGHIALQLEDGAQSKSICALKLLLQIFFISVRPSIDIIYVNKKTKEFSFSFSLLRKIRSPEILFQVGVGKLQ